MSYSPTTMLRILSALFVALLLSTGLSGASIAQDLVDLSESIEDLADERGVGSTGELHDFEEQAPAEAPEEVLGAPRADFARSLRGARAGRGADPQVALLASQPFHPPTISN
ncbi:hypothetical protein YTPLAS18_04980 [Nitrospira sp.]|nr:hypothetical protein YTPLAS18_04980 [Nitrospira sp.]